MTMMIRVLFLTRDLGYGGAQRQLIDLVRAMDKTRFNITVAAFYDGGRMQTEMASVEDMHLVSLHKRGRYDVYGFLSRLMKLMRDVRPQVIFTQNASSIFALAAGRSYKCCVILDILNAGINRPHVSRLEPLLFRFKAYLARHADLLIANSFAGREHYAAKGYPRDKVVVISNGFDTHRFYPSRNLGEEFRIHWGVSSDEVLIGLVGRLDDRKDHPSFLKAATIVCAIYPAARFVCVGDGEPEYFKKLQDLAVSLGISGGVIWAGAQTDMPAVYNALDILASTSACEGLSNVIGEAMACGVPCTATDVGDSAVLLGDPSRMSPPARPDLIADRWKMLLSISADERQRIGIRDRERIVKKFSLELLARRTESALSAVVNGRPVSIDQDFASDQ